jgi:hypothetical protein
MFGNRQAVGTSVTVDGPKCVVASMTLTLQHRAIGADDPHAVSAHGSWTPDVKRVHPRRDIRRASGLAR